MQFSAVLRKEGKQYSAWCPELDIASQGKNPDDAVANLREAVELYLEDEDAAVPSGSPLLTTFEVRHAKGPGAVRA